MSEKLIFEYSSPGKKGYTLPKLDVPEKPVSSLLPEKYLRKRSPELPEVSEVETVRHFVNLSAMNHHVDKAIYPLGSCTMKYNPKINEDLARLEGFSAVHPMQTDEHSQGCLQLMYELEKLLCEITGMDAATLQPAAGAHGELTGIMVMRKYLQKKGRSRSIILIPDSAHGTNPASVIVNGYKTLEVKSNEKGTVDLENLKSKVTEDVAGLMLTNPNTLGIFEDQVEKITGMLHEKGALVYMDGANLNALMGLTRPGDMGFDVVHVNLHKTFSTPHGGGGPGSGPIAVKAELEPFLPVPRIVKQGETYVRSYDFPDSLGKIHTFFGNFGVMVKAYAYIKTLGAQGIREVAENAVLNACYLKKKLDKEYYLPHKQPTMHEFVLSGEWQKERGAKTLDIAKRLLDYGVHAPTVYFPLIVKEALMIEPTESENMDSLDRFAEILLKISEEIKEDPEMVTHAPYTTPVRRLDEVTASRNLNVRYRKDGE